MNHHERNLYDVVTIRDVTIAGMMRRVWLQIALSALARSDTCASASDVTCSLFYFVLFIDYFLFESLNILQQ